MKTALVLIVALLMVGCANSFYHIDEGAIVQYMSPVEPPRADAPEGVVVDGSEGPELASADPKGDGSATQDGTGNRQQAVYIGSSQAPVTDADLEATIRDLFTPVD